MATMASHQSWADFVDEASADADDQWKDALAVVDDIVVAKESNGNDRKLNKDAPGIMALADGEPSVGSAQHRTGRCKPCAFFHTKGCQNDKACQFCHLCPPGEKQRRKRLRERMCEKLGQCLQRPAPFEQPDQRCFRSGHRRQASGASLGESSTQSTCSGWTQFSHSRQSSSSSVADNSGVVGTPMRGMPHMHQMMPVFHFAPSVMPPMVDGAECGTAEHNQFLQDFQRTAKSDGNEQEADALRMAAPLALSQVVPLPGKAQPTSVPAAPWQHTGVVQYAVVAVPVPQHQQHATDPAMNYGCFAQQPYPQMGAFHGEHAQWCMEAGANFAQPIF